MTNDMQTFKELLDAHDWTFQRSDDFRKWQRGWEQRQRIKSLAAKIGPDALEMYQVYWDKFGA